MRRFPLSLSLWWRHYRNSSAVVDPGSLLQRGHRVGCWGTRSTHNGPAILHHCAVCYHHVNDDIDKSIFDWRLKYADYLLLWIETRWIEICPLFAIELLRLSFALLARSAVFWLTINLSSLASRGVRANIDIDVQEAGWLLLDGLVIQLSRLYWRTPFLYHTPIYSLWR